VTETATPRAQLPAPAPPSVPPQPAAPLAPVSIALVDDATRQKRLDRMKRLATFMLIVSTGIYLAARLLEARYPWLGYVRATAEAAMIGGLADWFAVTALFKHPMGIPIPHTAIIPARKDRVGKSLGMFVERNFLSRDVLARKLQSLHVAEGLARWIANPENAHLVARQAASGLAAGAKLLRDEEVQDLIGRSIASRIKSTEAAPLLGKSLALLTAGSRQQELLDGALSLIGKAVAENRGLIRDRIERESPWWVPGVVDDKIHAKIVAAVENTIREVRENPMHPIRARFDTMLDTFIDKLQHSPEMIEKAEAMKEEFVSAETIRHISASVWEDVKVALIKRAESPESYHPDAIERGLTAFGEAILSDPALLEKIDRWVVDVALHLVERYQSEVSALISQTVMEWDPQATSRRIELAIGRDLQYIRINGTIVGALAGLAIYTFSRLLGP
jgi:uncharacterized membrane-anchored protein YjiN (DUF445 family)